MSAAKKSVVPALKFAARKAAEPAAKAPAKKAAGKPTNATDFSTQARFELPGSAKRPVGGAIAALASAAPGDIQASPDPVPPRSPVTVTVVVPAKTAIDTRTLGRAKPMSHAQYASAHGPDSAALKAVQAFAAHFGLRYAAPTPGRRAVQLTGPAAAMQRAFAVELKAEKVDGQTFRVRQGPILLPEGLRGRVEAVLGLDNRPQAVSHFRPLAGAFTSPAGANAATTQPTGFASPHAVTNSSAQHAGGIAAPQATSQSLTPVQVAALYGFPAAAKANGQTIGIVELGGGFRKADITAYFKTLNLPAPSVVAVSVDGGKNAPTGDPNGADGEVMLDIEICAAVAPGARIAVYFAPNTDQGFIDAIATAVHDRTNKPSVISISWGAAEINWTGQAMTALDNACQAAAALGISITVAAGDNGSTDGVTDGQNHVDFPASSPHVLACGGTKLTGTGSVIDSEVVWNELAARAGATGGGVSNAFPLPAWQAKSGVPKASTPTGGRGVPDISGNADPVTGYIVRVDGQTGPIGGTSAVSPLWAGLIALANAQNKTPAGFLNPTLYAARAKSALRDVTQGNNGAFSAGPGWDACTGLGSPVGDKLIALLGQSAPAKKAAGKGNASKPKKAAAKKSAGKPARKRA